MIQEEYKARAERNSEFVYMWLQYNISSDGLLYIIQRYKQHDGKAELVAGNNKTGD